MRDPIRGYEIWRLEMPTGRLFGDCKCSFDSMDFLVLALKTDQGRVGWGFMQTMSKGIFTNSAPWVSPLPALADLQNAFGKEFWPRLEGKDVLVARLQSPALFSGYGGMKQALRLAWWDLASQIADMPLYCYLGGSSNRDRVRAYGSGIDFPLSDEDAVNLFKSFVDMGFTAVKVKVGSPDPTRDLRRLLGVREAVGRGVEIAIDANEAWTCDHAIQRIRLFEREGIKLAYVEDPLPRNDMEGFARLAQSVEVDIVGQDYVTDDPKRVREFLERGALDRIRASTDIDEALAYAELAAEFGKPIIVGNTVFDVGVHAAIALPQTDRMEYSHVAWSALPKHPVRIEGGYAVAPLGPGHGLAPDPEQLNKYSRPTPSS